MTERIAYIVGAGPGISGAFGRALRQAGYEVALASRNLDKLKPLADSMGAHPLQVDAGSIEQIRASFEEVDRRLGPPSVVLYNPSARVRGELLSVKAEEVAATLQTTALGAFVVAQEAARRMLPKGTGAIFFTGATAGVKGFARSSSFAMGKFALRGLAQSLARELSPAGIHVAHFVIDGGVKPSGGDARTFTPEAIAQTYMAVLAQPPGAWSWEIELRSYSESF